MELFAIIILFISTLSYLYFFNLRQDKAEKERFREFVIASKSENVTEYVQAIPNNEPFEIKEEDELIDLDQMSPEQLLRIKQEEYENIKN